MFMGFERDFHEIQRDFVWEFNDFMGFLGDLIGLNGILCDLRPLGMFADLYTPANIFSICYKLH